MVVPLPSWLTPFRPEMTWLNVYVSLRSNATEPPVPLLTSLAMSLLMPPAVPPLPSCKMPPLASVTVPLKLALLDASTSVPSCTAMAKCAEGLALVFTMSLPSVQVPAAYLVSKLKLSSAPCCVPVPSPSSVMVL